MMEGIRETGGGSEFGTPGEMADHTAQLSLQSLDPSKREQVMSYLLEQLQAYQQQLRELELHRQWQQHTAAQERSKLPPIAGASGHAPEALIFSDDGGSPGVMPGGYAGHSMMSVNGPVSAERLSPSPSRSSATVLPAVPLAAALCRSLPSSRHPAPSAPGLTRFPKAHASPPRPVGHRCARGASDRRSCRSRATRPRAT